jgi:hypothetical protein
LLVAAAAAFSIARIAVPRFDLAAIAVAWLVS